MSFSFQGSICADLTITLMRSQKWWSSWMLHTCVQKMQVWRKMTKLANFDAHCKLKFHFFDTALPYFKTQTFLQRSSRLHWVTLFFGFERKGFLQGNYIQYCCIGVLGYLKTVKFLKIENRKFLKKNEKDFFWNEVERKGLFSKMKAEKAKFGMNLSLIHI